MRAILLSLLLLALNPHDAGAQAAGSQPRRLEGVRSWGYQLQKVDPATVAASAYDLVVIDYSRNGTDEGRFTPAEVKAMQRKPDGGRRIVLAYLSVGEAEDYRFYWDESWVEPAPLKRGLAGRAQPAGEGSTAAEVETVRIPRLVAPGWLGHENEVWAGNYLVRFWYDGWRDIIMHNDDSYLARIQGAGFDGVYLDRVDAFYAIERDHEDAASWMVELVVELGQKARGRNPGFVIVPQNAEELLDDPRYLAAIDGVAKEDLLFGAEGDGMLNTPERIAASLEHLQQASDAGLRVLIVEYLDERARKLATGAALQPRGYIPYFGTRRLDRLAPPPR